MMSLCETRGLIEAELRSIHIHSSLPSFRSYASIIPRIAF
jgi:hypothetical protein